MIERLKKYEGIDMDKEKHPGNPNFTVRDTIKLADEVAELIRQRDELLAAAEAIEINAEECLDWDDCTAMLVPIGDYHKLMEAVASVKEIHRKIERRINY